MSAPKPAKPACPLALSNGSVLGSLPAQALEIANFLVTLFAVRTQNVDAEINAFVADEHLRSGDQVFDLMLALAAKGAVQRRLLSHRSTRVHSRACRFAARILKTGSASMTP
jgi:hypothetical protein